MSLLDRRNEAIRSGLRVQLPQINPLPAPARPAPAPPMAAGAGASRYSQMGARMMNAKGAKAQAEEDAKPDGFWGSQFGQGLGVVLNNPVTKVALAPLNVLDMPRRATLAGIEEAYQHMPRGVGGFLNPNGVAGLPGQQLYDREGQAEDDRSFWDKLMDPEYGWGQISVDTGNAWVDNTTGFLGDIMTDPLTYVGFGAANQTANAGQEIMGRAARLSRVAQAAEDLNRAGLLDEQTIAQLRRVAEGGLNLADEATRPALGLQRPGLRLAGTDVVVPGTGKVADVVNKPIGGVRQAINTSRRGAGLRGTRTPVELERAMPILTGGKGTSDDFVNALKVFQFDQAARPAAQTFSGLASQELQQRAKLMQEELDSRFGGDMGEYLRAAEEEGGTVINEFGDRMRAIASDLGADLPELEGLGYVPHMLSSEFKKLLDGGGDFERMFMDATGVRNVDTLRDSGFLSKRALMPRGGKPLKLKIGDKTMTITKGTVQEINDEVAKLFPQLKGTALETSPTTLFERYISGVSGDVGQRVARKEMIERGVEGFRDFDTNAVGRSQVVSHGTDPFAEDDFWKGVVDEKGSAEANKQVRRSAQQTKEMQQGIADELRRDVADSASEYRTGMTKELQGQARELSARSRSLQQRMEVISGNVKNKRAAQAQIKAEAEAHARTLRAQAGALTRRIKAIPEQVAGRVDEAQRAAIRRMRSELDQLKTEAEELNEIIARYSDVEVVAAKRAEVAAALREAEQQYDTVYRAMGGDLSEPVAVQGGRHAATQAELETVGTKFDDPVRQATPTAEREGLKAAPVSETAADGVPASTPDKLVADRKRLAELQDQAGQIKSAQAKVNRLVQEKNGIPARRKQLKALITRAHEQIDLANDAAETRRLNKVVDELGQELRDLPFKEKALKKSIAKARAEVRELKSQYGDVNAKVKRLDTKVNSELERRAAANAPVEGPTMQEALDYARRQVQVERGRLERQALTAEELQQIEQNLMPMGVWERMFPGRRSAATGELLPTSPRDVNRYDFYNRLVTVMSEGAKTGVKGRARRVQGAIDRGSAELMSSIAREPGSETARIAAEGATETNARLTMPTVQRTKKLREANEALEKGRQEVDRINREIGGSYDEYKQLMTDDKALRQQRYEVQRAADAAPASRDPKMRLERSDAGKGNPDLPEELRLRPDRGKGKKALADADVRDAGLWRAQPLASSIDDIETMVRLNPNMDDETLRQAEVLLHEYRTKLENASVADMKANQAQAVIDSASKGEMVDVVLAMIDQNKWKIMPEGDRAVATDIARLMNNVKNTVEPRFLGRLLTSFTNFFKTYATLSPGFHVRNAISAVFMNAADGVSMQHQMQGLELWQKFMGADDPLAFFQQLPAPQRQAFEATFGSGAGGRFFESGVAESTAVNRTRLKEGIFRNKLTVGSQKLGQRVEGSVRLGMALDTIANGGSVEDALNRITRIHFDYSQVSNFDEAAKRLIPFWTFMSRNLPMQYSMMWMKPRAYNRYNSFVRNFSVVPDEYTPEYILESGGFDTGLETPDLPGMSPGMPIFLQPDLAHTRLTEDLEKFENVLSGENPGQLLADFNPFFTAPIEYIQGRNLYTGREYDETDYRPASGAVDTLLMPLMMALGQTKRADDGTMLYQEKGFDALRSLVPPLDRTARLAPGTAGGEADDRTAESWLRFFGAPIRTVSDKQRENEQRSRYYDQLDEARIRELLAGGYQR